MPTPTPFPVQQDLCGLLFITNSMVGVNNFPVPQINPDALASSEFTLNRQKDVQDILNNENNRLVSKKALVDNAMQGQVRMLTLNESYRQKNAQYRNLILLAILGLALFIGIIFLKRNFPTIPESLLNLLLIIIISVIIIYGAWIYYYILIRNNVYFDRLSLAPPATFDASGSKAPTVSPGSKGSLFSAMGGECYGPDCCDVGTTWDDTTMKCIIASSTGTPPGTMGSGAPNTNIAGFTTMSQAYESSDITSVNHAYSGYGIV